MRVTTTTKQNNMKSNLLMQMAALVFGLAFIAMGTACSQKSSAGFK